MLKISAYSSRELLTVLRGIRNLDRETRKMTRQHLRGMVLAAWQETLAQHADTRLEHRVLVGTGRVTVSDQNVKLKSASLSRSLSGGLKPSENYGPVEFGANPKVDREMVQHRSGTKFARHRNVHQPFKRPNRQGNVVYPAAASVIPRIFAMYVQTFARTIHEAFEGKSSSG